MIIHWKNIASIREQHPDKRIIFAGGCFDLIHSGHIHFLNQQKARGDILVIALAGDRRIRERKGPTRPIIKQNERARLLNELRSVDYIAVAPYAPPGGERPTLRLMKALLPDVFATVEPQWLMQLAEIESLGAHLVIVSKKKNVNSTSKIIEKILDVHSV
jgi:D-beta-D-heptose 7-phosphate kinase/D-beta-D-heptose 1-phosphate adenosyltransferase